MTPTNLAYLLAGAAAAIVLAGFVCLSREGGGKRSRR